MKIISIQSIAGGTVVTLTAAEIALTAMAEGQSVLAIDTSPYRCLERDIGGAGFQYLEEVRRLFRPFKEGRWQLPALPRHAILHHPESQPDFIAMSAHGGCEVAFQEKAGRATDAQFNLWSNIAWINKQYDIMVIDVLNMDRLLMQTFHDSLFKAGWPSLANLKSLTYATKPNHPLAHTSRRYEARKESRPYAEVPQRNVSISTR